jgi:hypothetical protein
MTMREGSGALVPRLVGLFVVLTCSVAAGQELPQDMRPFVKLGYEFSVEVFRGPTVRDGQVVDPGTLIDGPRRQIVTIHGSGTVISRDGLILTNFHVYEPVTQPFLELDKKRNLLVKGTPIGRHMLVFENDLLDPMKVPTLRYRALPLAHDEELDVTLLKIVAAADGSRLVRQDFAFVELGNPYGIPWQRRLTLIGYPGKGGETVTVTEGKFLGYTRGARGALDGSIKTDGAIAGGNSGGAALYDRKLVGLPTRGSFKNEKGSDFGYIHPVTWGLSPLVYAALRYGQPVPEIDPRWVQSEHNTDLSRTRLYIGGKIVAAESTAPLEGVEVLVHRADRTLEQVVELDQEMRTLRAVTTVRRLLAEGLGIEEVARRLKLRPQEVKDLAGLHLDESTVSADARRLLDGEFFYAVDRSRPDGFYFAPAPRAEAFRVVLSREGYRPRVIYGGPHPDRLWVPGGVIPLFQQGR